VYRRLACITLCAALLLAGACGSDGVEMPDDAQAAVAVKAGPVLDAVGRHISVFMLTPTGGPSGVVALKQVRDGSVRTLGHMRFKGMNDVGSVAVEVTGKSIVAFWRIPSDESASATRFALLPPRSTDAGRGWTDLTVSPGADLPEAVFWVQDRYIGRQPTSYEGSPVGADLDSVVRESRRSPERVSFCLTLKVDGP
jgi:hypothetical protein